MNDAREELQESAPIAKDKEASYGTLAGTEEAHSAPLAWKRIPSLEHAKQAFEHSEQASKHAPHLPKLKAVQNLKKVIDATKDQQSFWDKNSSPLMIVLQTVGMVAQQVAVLLITAQSLLPWNMDLVNNCVPEEMGGFLQAVVCEWTKSFVRGFPIVALIAALVVAQRVILSKRTFYHMLKQGGLLHFAEHSPFEDRLFLFLCFAFLMACLHFVINVTMLHGDTMTTENLIHRNMNHNLKETLRLMAASWIIPSGIFMLFLFTSYDLCATIMPFSKYFQENPEEAKEHISTLRMVEEDEAADLVSNIGVQSIDDDTGDPEELASRVWNEIIDVSSQTTGAPALSGTFASMWPARVLLDPRLQDADSEVFNAVWQNFLLGCFLLEALGIAYIIYQIRCDVDDVIGGAYDDVASLIGQIGCGSLSINLAISNAYMVCWRLFPNSAKIREQLERDQHQETTKREETPWRRTTRHAMSGIPRSENGIQDDAADPGAPV